MLKMNLKKRFWAWYQESICPSRGRLHLIGQGISTRPHHFQVGPTTIARCEDDIINDIIIVQNFQGQFAYGIGIIDPGTKFERSTSDEFTKNLWGRFFVTISWSKTTLNYWMMVERYPNLKEEVGGSIPGCEISSLLDRTLSLVVVNCLLCFSIGMSSFCLRLTFKKNQHISSFTLVISRRGGRGPRGGH